MASSAAPGSGLHKHPTARQKNSKAVKPHGCIGPGEAALQPGGNLYQAEISQTLINYGGASRGGIQRMP